MQRIDYRYPASPWSYCAVCGGAMAVDEQLVALERARTDGGVAALTGSPPLPPPLPERPLMTVAEVGGFFGKSNQAIYKMVERGQLPGATRVGRRLYVRRADLLRSLAEGRVPSPGRSR